MVTVAEIFRESEKILKSADIDTYHFDAMCVIEDVLNMRFGGIVPIKSISAENENSIRAMIKKRSEGYPLQYILGEWEFYGLPFKVGEGVLIPRPDTETLVEKVLEYCGKRENLKIIDLCSGSGCIAVSVEKNTINSAVYAAEFSDKAYNYLEKNILLNDSDVKAVKCDVLSENTAEKFSEYDVIVSNPPYLTEKDMNNLQKEVSFEPSVALDGSADGLKFYREIPHIWRNSLKKGGLMAFEIGMGQEKDVMRFMADNNFTDIKTADDLAGITRVVTGIKK